MQKDRDEVLLLITCLVCGLVLLLLIVAAYRGTTGDTRRFTPPRVTVYEDGSGVQTFPAGTFTWNCQEQGNEVCG